MRVRDSYLLFRIDSVNVLLFKVCYQFFDVDDNANGQEYLFLEIGVEEVIPQTVVGPCYYVLVMCCGRISLHKHANVVLHYNFRKNTIFNSYRY